MLVTKRCHQRNNESYEKKAFLMNDAVAMSENTLNEVSKIATFKAK